MSRIDASACFCMDMEWYGVDKKGNIAVFCSAGEGYLPEFICEDEERACELIEVFDRFEKYTQSTLLIKGIERAQQVARDFSDKGLYYFDSDDGTRYGICTLHEYYTRHSVPEIPLKYSTLPEPVRERLKYNMMDVEDFSMTEKVYVEHAYKIHNSQIKR